MVKHLADTSVLIAAGPFGGGGEVAISVVTVGELRSGVLSARDARTRTLRDARLTAIRTAFQAIPVDEDVAEAYGAVHALARRQRRQTTSADLLIIATASATGRALLTRDRAQAQLAFAAGLTVNLVGDEA